jgi:hypothetical protein
MRTAVISLSLLILLLACGRIPEDPGGPRKPVMPGVGKAMVLPASAPAGREADLPGYAPAPVPRTFPARSKPLNGG